MAMQIFILTKQVVFDYILPIYFVILYKEVGGGKDWMELAQNRAVGGHL